MKTEEMFNMTQSDVNRDLRRRFLRTRGWYPMGVGKEIQWRHDEKGVSRKTMLGAFQVETAHQSRSDRAEELARWATESAAAAQAPDSDQPITDHGSTGQHD